MQSTRARCVPGSGSGRVTTPASSPAVAGCTVRGSAPWAGGAASTARRSCRSPHRTACRRSSSRPSSSSSGRHPLGSPNQAERDQSQPDLRCPPPVRPRRPPRPRLLVSRGHLCASPRFQLPVSNDQERIRMRPVVDLFEREPPSLFTVACDVSWPLRERRAEQEKQSPNHVTERASMCFGFLPQRPPRTLGDNGQ